MRTIDGNKLIEMNEALASFLEVVSLQQERQNFDTVADGNTGIRVDKRVPRNKEIFVTNSKLQ